MNSLLLSLHVLAAVIWVGGMFFAHQCLRPVAASQLEPPVRLTQWVGVFGRFFPWVWIAVVLMPVTGYILLFGIYQSMANAPLYVHIMSGLGLLMILIYLFVYFVPYQKLKDAVATQAWPTGAKHLASIRFLVGVNLSLGLILIAIASGGRYFV
ncbi:MAG: CopD family protein [Gammaproteobacteria bacterium]|nr:CopD family protein [Gammaproteobacteria bacterium]